MINQVHSQLLSELENASGSDSVFVVGAVSFNFIAMVICWNMGGSHSSLLENTNQLVIFSILMLSVVLFTTLATNSMANSEKLCRLYHDSLITIYKDHNVIQYFPENMVSYAKRSSVLRKLFVLLSGVLAVTIPIIDELL